MLSDRKELEVTTGRSIQEAVDKFIESLKFDTYFFNPIIGIIADPVGFVHVPSNTSQIVGEVSMLGSFNKKEKKGNFEITLREISSRKIIARIKYGVEIDDNDQQILYSSITLIVNESFQQKGVGSALVEKGCEQIITAIAKKISERTGVKTLTILTYDGPMMVGLLNILKSNQIGS